MATDTPYFDPTGDTAAANVDSERELAALNDAFNIGALRELHEHAARPRQSNGPKALTNDMAVRALIALGAQSISLTALLAPHHTPDKEATWEPDNASSATTDWWDSEPAKSEL